VSEDVMFAYGNRKELPRMEVSTSPFSVTAGVEYHAEVQAKWGYLFGGPGARVQDFKLSEQRYDAVFGNTAAAHFAPDDAVLNPAARGLLRFFCAAELKSLSSEAASLRIIGYTDTTASDAHNLRLSKLRAQNALQAIKDILGPKLRAQVDEASGVVGLGEGPARRDIPDNTSDLRHRRVEIELDGAIRLVLQG